LGFHPSGEPRPSPAFRGALGGSGRNENARNSERAHGVGERKGSSPPLISFPSKRRAGPRCDARHDHVGLHGRRGEPGFFTQEEARTTESVAAASRVGVDDHGFGDGTQDVDEEEEEQAPVDEDDDAPELTSTVKGRKKRKKTSSPTEPRVKWTGKEEECLAEAWKTVSMNGITGAN
jgi:hypothetical protein